MSRPRSERESDRRCSRRAGFDYVGRREGRTISGRCRREVNGRLGDELHRQLSEWLVTCLANEAILVFELAIVVRHERRRRDRERC